MSYLLLILKFLTVEAIEQQGKEEIEHHEIAHNKRGQEDEETALSAAGLLSPHTVP